MITIYTDGSARGNPGPGGWGAIIAFGKNDQYPMTNDEWVKEIGGKDAYTTNNKMELTAAIEALKNIPANSEVELHSDSSYVVKGITEWIHGWRAKGWKTAGKKPVLNQDLWEKLFEVIQDKHIEWKLVAGHAGLKANERCDEIATTFADNLPVELYDGPRSMYKYL